MHVRSFKRAYIECGLWFALACGMANYSRHVAASWRDAVLVICGVALTMSGLLWALIVQEAEKRKKAKKEAEDAGKLA